MPNWRVPQTDQDALVYPLPPRPEPTDLAVGYYGNDGKPRAERDGYEAVVFATWTEAKSELIRRNRVWLDAHRNMDRMLRALRKPGAQPRGQR